MAKYKFEFFYLRKYQKTNRVEKTYFKSFELNHNSEKPNPKVGTQTINY